MSSDGHTPRERVDSEITKTAEAVEYENCVAATHIHTIETHIDAQAQCSSTLCSLDLSFSFVFIGHSFIERTVSPVR